MGMAPEIVVIAGPNGAGKSTLARLLLPEVMPFLNADEIAKVLPDSVRNKEVESGPELLRRMDSLVAKRQRFAIETTLSSRSLAPNISRLQEIGYWFHLFFLRLPESEMAVERVAARVRRGGHDIPKEVIRSRSNDEVTRRFQVAVREALLDHKRAKNSVAIWRDGKVVIVSPEEIEGGP